MIKVFSYRVKDSNSAKHLDRMARAVNYVWNFCGDSQRHALKWDKKWPSGYDLNELSAGCAKDLGLHSQTVQAVGQEYALRRKQHKKRLLRFRGKKSLGWIPFKRSGIKVEGDSFIYCGHRLKVWQSKELEGSIKSGSFSQDARGRWYLNLACEVTKPVPLANGKAVGIDLGLKTLAVIHDGQTVTKIERERFYRDMESKLAESQQRGTKSRTRSIHAKIANRRKDYLHKVSTEIANKYQYIFIGDVSSSKLAKTKMAKSVMDVGWYQLKVFVENKANARESLVKITNESHTTIECSTCHERTGPSGLKDLDIREWDCSNCLTHHDRDGNSGLNIRNRGMNWLGQQLAA